MQIKSGNDVVLEIECKDQDGVLIDNLATTTEIICEIKTSKAIVVPTITKKKTLGEILVNDPSTGYVKVIINSVDTVSLNDEYYIAVELRWAGNTQEIDLADEDGDFETILIKEDIII